MDLKAGDVICFKVDIKNPPSPFFSAGLHYKVATNSLGDEIITKGTPVQLVNITKAHIHVKYNNRIIKLRRIDSRMYKAGPAAQILYGENNAN